jgi:hypothetical protein
MPEADVMPAHEPGLGPDLRAHLGAQLRAAYREVVNEPIPQRFLRLLDELEHKGAAG